ncbi:hypothetical protein [Thermocrinis jamiesonii]|jgi:hypothetical protein|uniref:hypothetical protein n=1 Tax=Thermocrinis jamiesonii TaxID=1302351 RepID=UPI0004954420|nr:hypothetical protein [Thermocrinis jamiesonii]
MGDIQKAGSDRGNLEKELEHTLISIKMIYRGYMLTIEEYTKEELMGDLEEYRLQFKRVTETLLSRAKNTEIPKLIEIAEQIEWYYTQLIEAIKQRLTEYDNLR